MITEVSFIRLFVIRYRLRANIKFEHKKSCTRNNIVRACECLCVHVNFYARMQNIVHAREKSCTRKKYSVRIQIWYTHKKNLARAKYHIVYEIYTQNH